MIKAEKILFSYNLHGNVDTLLQDYGNSTGNPNAMNTTGNRFKKIVYQYDLISGKVNEVNYQPGQADAFYHRYSYDAENRITDVETSNDKIVWERDARYSYYRHGPLARTVLGQNQVQGIDYAYTLQGQLKGINSTSVGDGSFDMGQDGKIGSSNSNIARDVYGIALNYFTGDYKPINNTITPFANIPTGNDLFNGNIKSQVVNIPKLGDALTYVYGYDQLNRLTKMDAYNGLNNASNTFTAITINDYKERLTYDPNGNIKTYLRNGTGATINLNNYSYTYTAGTNKLASITNSVNAQTKNYAYDEIGNTTTDGMQGMTNAVWNVYGKLQSATNKDGASVTYTYSADGQRISKTVGAVTECYVKDATGNTMVTYKKEPAINNNDLTATGFYKYGSSLLSVKDAKINVEHPVVNNGTTTFERGNDNYILTDANGNTRVTIKDTRTQVPDPANPLLVLYYTANVSTATFSSTYGANAKTFNGGFEAANFNGQRKSLEIGADAQTAEFWEYNGDIGRRANVDPIPKVYESPYVGFGGNPICNIDPTGSDTINITKTTTRQKYSKNSAGSNSGNTGIAKNATPADKVSNRVDINIKASSGEDVFRYKNVNITIDDAGNEAKSEAPWETLNIRGNASMAYRSTGTALTERMKLAGMVPSGLLDYYAEKNRNSDFPIYVATLDAKALQSTMPFAASLNRIQNYVYTASGLFGVARFTLSKFAVNSFETELAKRGVLGQTEHFGERMAERGFTNQSILKIIDKGMVREQVYKGQCQIVYRLGDYKVVMDANIGGRNFGKVVNVMGDFNKVGANGVKGPFLGF